MDDVLETFAEQVLGPCRVEDDCSWAHRGPRVLRIRDAGGVCWYAKQHLYADQNAREVTAYQSWVPSLGDRAPRLRAYDSERRALVVSAVPGAPFAGDDVDVHREAGALLRTFHEAEVLPPWTDLAAHKLAELEYWAARSGGVLERRELDFARAELRSLQGIPAPARVPCHLDYSPRNWLVDGDRVHVIDFELATLEVWVNDLGRLWFGPWRTRPHLRDVFLEGYGRRPDDDEIALLVKSYAFTAIWHIVWAREHGNTTFEAGVRDILRALMCREFG